MILTTSQVLMMGRGRVKTGEPEDCWCTECKEPCRLEEETFNYSGTHCNHGIAGTHHTGIYVSDCCGESYTYEDPNEAQRESY